MCDDFDWDYPAYRPCQVRFPGTKLYTYLYPAHWDLKVGDHVRHPGMWGGTDWATVELLNHGIDPNKIPKATDLYVLTEYKRPKVLNIDVPRGTKVIVHEIDV